MVFAHMAKETNNDDDDDDDDRIIFWFLFFQSIDCLTNIKTITKVDFDAFSQKSSTSLKNGKR